MTVTTRTARPTRTRVAASAAALAATALVLAGCAGGGNDADGTYYTEDVNGTSDLGQLVVDGGTFTHHEYDCNGVYEEPDVTSTGEYDPDTQQVVWVAGDDSRNERTGSEDVAITENAISIGGDNYLKDDSEAGAALIEAHEEGCAEDGEPMPEAEPVPDGTYYTSGRPAVARVDIEEGSATSLEVSCEADYRIEGEASISENNHITWESVARVDTDGTTNDVAGSIPRGELVLADDGSIELVAAVGSDDQVLHPEGSDEAEALLDDYEQECGASFPSS